MCQSILFVHTKAVKLASLFRRPAVPAVQMYHQTILNIALVMRGTIHGVVWELDLYLSFNYTHGGAMHKKINLFGGRAEKLTTNHRSICRWIGCGGFVNYTTQKKLRVKIFVHINIS